MNNKKEKYLPNDRTSYKPDPQALVSQSAEGISTTLPNPVEDPIVVNNIANQEFDYTENPLE